MNDSNVNNRKLQNSRIGEISKAQYFILPEEASSYQPSEINKEVFVYQPKKPKSGAEEFLRHGEWVIPLLFILLVLFSAIILTLVIVLRANRNIIQEDMAVINYI